MGTYETVAIAIGHCLADVTGNGIVNIDDLLMVIANWGQPGGPADVNHNGIVNIDDLLMVIGNWGACQH